MSLDQRIIRFAKRNLGTAFCRKPIGIRPGLPLISFTFDDFPRSALLRGGQILGEFGLSATYYVALGLLGQDSPSGQICLADDLRKALEDGHELGSHTYSHCHSWDTRPELFEESVLKNGAVLSEMISGEEFRSFSYPICAPHPAVKRRTARHFESCRGEGQTLNAGRADLNQLSAFFLERARDDLGTVQRLIDRNVEERGWIIFATHDIDPSPSRYGCSPGFFEKVVRYAVGSGACIVPVSGAVRVLRERAMNP